MTCYFLSFIEKSTIQASAGMCKRSPKMYVIINFQAEFAVEKDDQPFILEESVMNHSVDTHVIQNDLETSTNTDGGDNNVDIQQVY